MLLKLAYDDRGWRPGQGGILVRTWLSSLRARLIFLVLLALLPALGLILYTDDEDRRNAANQAMQQALRVATLASDTQQGYVGQLQGLLPALSVLPEIQSSNSTECSQLLAQLQRSYPFVTNIGAADLSGDIYCSAVPSSGPVNISDRLYFQEAVQSRGFSVGTYLIGRITGLPSITFGYPIIDAENQLRGVVFTAVGLEWLNRLVSDAELPKGSVLTVIDRQGTVLAQVPNSNISVGKTAPEAQVFRAIQAEQGSGTATATGIDGVTRLYGFTSLGGLPPGSGYVSVGIPTAVAFAQANATLARNMAGLGIIALLTIAAAWFGSDLLVLRRTRRLIEASRRLADGDLSARTGLPYGLSELGVLARTFDEMAANLSQRAAERAREEERFRCVTEGSLAGVYILQDDKFRYVNPALAQIFGYSPEEMVDRLGPFDLADAADRAIVAERIRKRLDGELETVRYTWHGVARNGDALFLETLGRRWILDSRPAIIGTIIDLTERKKAEDALTRANRALRTLSESNESLVRAPDEGALLSDVCRILVKEGGYRFAWVGRAERDDQRTVQPIAQAGYEQGYLEGLEISWGDTDRGRGPTGTAIRTGRPVITLDVPSDPTFAPWREEAMKRGYASSIALPLPSGNADPLGALCIYSAEPNAFDDQEVGLLTELANDLGYGIEALRNRAAQRQAQEQVERQLIHLESLRTIETAIASSLDLRTTLSVFLDQVTVQLRVDSADVLLLNPQSQILEYAQSRGFQTEALKHTHLRLGEGFAGKAASQRSPVRIPSLEKAQSGLERAPLLPAEGFAAYYAIPLVAKGTVKGVLEIFHRSPLNPDEEWEEFLQTLAAEAALAIDNAGLFADLQRANMDLTIAYDATIEGWSRAMDMRDKETEGHTQRVTYLTEKVATVLGISGEALLHVRRGALLHDIGKMGVPDAILLKPGPLTDEEWVVMRKHPEFAYQMLSPIPYLRPAIDIPYCHHEKWDGSGYPRQLKREEIPLAARAFAVVDVWDALRSDRPYRPRWPLEKVTQHILDQSGKHFEPRVVQAFLEVLREAGDDQR